MISFENPRKEILEAINAVLDGGQFIGGEFVEAFENEWADYCGVKHCVGVGNGTDAIFIALKAIGVGVGDEVITAANTYVGTANAILATGATPVYVDCGLDYNIDPEKMNITGKTKAIIPVHLYGRPANMPRIMSKAKKAGVYVVSDCAQAHGATIRGINVAQFGDLATFSFYPTKNLGALGDAGAIVGNSHLLHKCRELANQTELGQYNSRLDPIQAAILSVKLNYLDKYIAQRIQRAFEYNRTLKGFDIVKPEMLKGHVWHQYVIRTKQRDELMRLFKGSKIHYPTPLAPTPNATQFASEILSLPL